MKTNMAVGSTLSSARTLMSLDEPRSARDPARG
jgi:hypothetical protein